MWVWRMNTGGDGQGLRGIKGRAHGHGRGDRRFLQGTPGHVQVPKQVEFREALPKSAVGKILRKVLRDEEEAKTKCENHSFVILALDLPEPSPPEILSEAEEYRFSAQS